MLAKQASIKLLKGAQQSGAPLAEFWLPPGRLAQAWLSSLKGRSFSAQPAPIENYEEQLGNLLPEPVQQLKSPQYHSQACGLFYTAYKLMHFETTWLN